MKFKATLFPAFILLLCITFWSWSNKEVQPNATGSEFVLMELFTSEGCANCPPAEELFNEMVSKKEPEVYMISYHVDYWNKNGWTDVFSKNEFSQRQYEYSAFFELKDHYTPQMVVNGTSHCAGSHKGKIDKATKTKAIRENEISIETSIDGNAIAVDYKVFGEVAGKNLYLMLVQKEATVEVNTGENKGKTLKHSNIEIDYKEIRLNNTDGNKTVHVPSNLQSSDYFIMAFVQNGETKKVTGIEVKQ